MTTKRPATPMVIPSPRMVHFELNNPMLQDEDIAIMLGNDLIAQGGVFKQKHEEAPVGYRPDPHILSLAEHKEGLIRRAMAFSKQYFEDPRLPYRVKGSIPAPRQNTAELMRAGKAWTGGDNER